MSTEGARRTRISSTCLLYELPCELRQTVVPSCTPDQSLLRALAAPEYQPIYDRESIRFHSTPFHRRWRTQGRMWVSSETRPLCTKNLQKIEFHGLWCAPRA